MPRAVTTRPAVESDRPAVRDIFVRATGADLAAFDEALDLDRTTIVEAGGIAVGFVLLAETPYFLQVHTIAIAPEHQHNGIGSEVLTDLIAIGRMTGRDVILSVRVTNPRAEALYARLGFRVVEETATHRHMRFAGAGTSG